MVSVVILAKNEAHNLAELLPTLDFADKVLVIDDESVDRTAEICKQHRVERITHPLNGDFAESRNYALSLVKKGWMLFLDADERLPDWTVKEVLRVTSRERDSGYAFKRKDIFYNKELNWGETKNVWIVRLAMVGKGKWVGKVHEEWKVEKVKKIEGVIYHYSHSSVKQLFQVIREYALLRSKELYKEKKYWRLDEQLFNPIFKFIYLFIIKLGVLDGWRGLVMSTAMAYHSFLVRWYLWDIPWIKHNFKLILWRRLVIIPLVLLPFGQLFRGSVWGIPIYAHEIFMGLALVVSLWCVKFERKQFKDKQVRAMLLFSLILGLSFLTSIIRGMPLSAGLYLVRWLMYVAYLGILVWGVSQGLRTSIAGFLTYISASLIGLGWAQYLWFPDTRKLALLGWDDHYYRMIGSLLDPNFLGILFVLIIIWAGFEMKRSAGWGVAALAITSLPATFSRGSWLTLMLVAVGYIVLNQKWKQIKVMILTGLILGLILWLLPKPGGESVNIGRWYSVVARVENLEQGLQVFKNYPVLGIGFNQHGNYYQEQGKYGVEYHPQSPDNSFVFILETAGVLGFGAFLYMLWVWWKIYPKPVMRLSLAAIMIHSMINNSFFYPFILLWWWLLIAYQQEKRFIENK